uniref:Uncharacterized protein n=1 Tax=Caenorhabditis tropicalis TaxID=1561998 RepID=A0A1I7U3I4_9PELO
MTKSTKLRHCKQKKKKPEKAEKTKPPILVTTERPSTDEVATTSSTTDALLGSSDGGGSSRSKSRNRRKLGLCCCTAQTATLSPLDPSDYGGIASTSANNGMVGGGLSRESRAPSRTSRRGSSRSQVKNQDPEEPSTSGTAERRPSTHFMLDLPVVSTRCKYFCFMFWFSDILI